jgi:hypothetical protein
MELALGHVRRRIQGPYPLVAGTGFEPADSAIEVADLDNGVEPSGADRRLVQRRGAVGRCQRKNPGVTMTKQLVRQRL